MKGSLSGVLKELERLETEKKAYDLSQMDPYEIVRVSVEDNARGVLKILEVKDEIVALARAWADTLMGDGRVILLGAGTSGRLAIMEAAEMYPTFGIGRDRVLGFIAGGRESVFASKEGAEDKPSSGKRLMSVLRVGKGDLVVGLSASGRTPYVRGAIEKAMSLGAKTAVITTNPCGVVPVKAHVKICVEVGPEILPGSTRMKSASVQKVVLNTVSLLAAVFMGKVERGRMVSMVPTSEKLKGRAVRTLMEEFSLGQEEAIEVLERNRWNLHEAFKDLEKGG